MTTPREPIAVVGVSALFPGSTSAAGFWRDILRGVDRIGDVPPHRWLIEDYYDPDPKTPDRTYGRRGGFLDAVDFDAMKFGMPPNLAPVTDSSQLLALIVANRVLEDACRGDYTDVDRSRASCILGVTSAQELLGHMVSRLQRPVWVKALRESGLPENEVQDACDRIESHYQPWQEATFPGLLGNVVAGRVANRLDLGGTNCVTDAACASALSALSMAVNELWLGESDLVITGGVDTMTDPLMYMCFSKTPALSPTGDVRPFSDAADGTLLGEGVGMVALKRLADARASGDPIYAVLRGVGSSSDGRAKSVYAPRASGQAKALQRAYAQAGYGPETVELVEAHGTGTKAGDAAEFAGLCEVFAPAAPGVRQWCALGTVKSQIGHAKAAAGAAGLFKCVMALHQRVLPPTIKVERPNPALEIDDSPFYLVDRARPWIRNATHRRRGSVSSFGFGGTNFHATLEEWDDEGVADRFCGWPSHLLILSADSSSDVAVRARQMATRIGDVGLERAAWESHRAPSDGSARLAVVASDDATAIAALGRAADRLETDGQPFETPDGVCFDWAAVPGEVAFLFSGQGSQHVGMGGDVAIHFASALAVHDAAAAIPVDGDPLHRIQFPPPAWDDASRSEQARRLTATENAQPCIGITSAATLAVLRQAGVEATHFAGHSYGEVSALYAAGALDLDAFVRASRERGERMANASDVPGGMLAIVATREDVESRLAAWGDPVVVANHNHPTQVVVSGPIAAIDAVETRCAEAGLRSTRLPVSTAFHSPLVADASQPFAEALAGLAVSRPRGTVWSNSTAAPHDPDPDRVRAALAAQIARPVRFVEQIRAMHAAGVRTFVEVGPGSIQSRLVSRILSDVPHRAVATDVRGRDGATSLWSALGALYVAGVSMNVASLWAGLREPVDATAQAKPRLTIPVDGGNVDAPYPPKGGAAALPPPNPPRASGPVSSAASRPPAGSTSVSTLGRPVAPVRTNAAPAGVAGSPRQPNSSPASAPRAAASPPRSPMRDDDRTSGPLPPDAARAWVDAWADAQRQAAYAHAAWQHAMTEAHTAYLRASEASFAALHALAGVAPPAMAPPVATRPAPPSPPVTPQPWAAPSPPAAPQPWQPAAPSPVAPPPAPSLHASARAPDAPVPAPAVMPSPSPSVVSPATVGAAPPTRSLARPGGVASLSDELLAVVADKTGYPVEMLQLDMSLEGDLGIDSIKRVEILSALTERVPSLPDVDASEMGALQTLGEIVSALGDGSGAASSNGAPHNGAVEPSRAVEPAPASTPAGASAPGAELEGELLAVVADKTGYPVDMLQLEMSLEGDLGIDSIKRVEILSALSERVPSLPDVDASEMGALQTLGEIVARLREASADGPGGNPVNPEYGRFDVVEAPVPAADMVFGPWGPGARLAIAPLTNDAVEDGQAIATAAERAGLLVVTELATADLVVAIAPSTDELAACREGWARLFALAREVSACNVRGLAVVWTTTGQRDALNDGIAGFCRTAACEWPEVHVRGISLPSRRSSAARADLVVAELSGGAENTVVDAGSPAGRTVQVHTPSARPTGRLAVESGDVVVVSGGARGVTARCVIALAGEVGAHFVLLGRSDAEVADPTPNVADAQSMMPALLAAARERGETVTPADLRATARRILAAREIRETLAAIRATGSTGEYVRVDVTDGAALASALDRVRSEHGPVRAVVHAAGVLADKRLAEKTDDMVERVIRTKVDGFAALLAATADDPLRALVVFSSVAARTGNAGQADYALANAAITAMTRAEATRRHDLHARAIAWGPWDGGMVDPSLRDHFRAAGVPLIDLAAGARSFVDEMRRGGALEVVIGATPRAGGIAADPAAERVTHWLLDGDRHAWLFDHVVQGVPVLPLAASIDLMARASRTLWPTEHLAELHGVSVRRPIRLAGLNNGGERITCRAKRDGDRVTLTLEARGEVAVSATGHFGGPSVVTALEPGETAPRTAETYGGALFHGPAFQVIRPPMRVGTDGATAVVDGLRSASWDRAGFALDVPAIDALLQVAVRWAERALGSATLPMGIERVMLAAPPHDGPMQAAVVGSRRGRSAASVRATLATPSGRGLVGIDGVSLIVRPDAADVASPYTQGATR